MVRSILFVLLIAGLAGQAPAQQKPDTLTLARYWSAPNSLWPTNFGASFASPLPQALQDSLSLVVDSLLADRPGVQVAVALPGQGLWQSTRGWAVPDSLPLLADARFQIGSITKTYTAVLILQLVEEGQLTLEEKLATWLPDAPAADSITVRHLLQHTSGLFNFLHHPRYLLDQRAYLSPADALEIVQERGLDFPTGSRLSYTNTGYIFLGQIIEKITGKPLHTVMQERIFTPQGLSRTTLRYQQDGQQVTPCIVFDKPYDSHKLINNYATAFAAGGIASTAEEVVRFYQALLSHQLTQPATTKLLFTDMHRWPNNNHLYYGLGIMAIHHADRPFQVLHTGGIMGFSSIVVALPQEPLLMCILVNSLEGKTEAAARQLLGAYMRWKAARP